MFLFSPVIPVKKAVELLNLAKEANEHLYGHALETARIAKANFINEYTKNNVFSDNNENALVAWDNNKPTIFVDRTEEMKNRVFRMSTNIDHVGKFNMATTFTISPEMVAELLDTIPADLREAGLDDIADEYSNAITTLLYS